MNLKNKTVLITGASRGIGRTTAILAGKVGAKVAVNFVHQQKLAKETVSLIEESGGKAISFQCDVTKFSQTNSLIKETVKTFGSLDILINNAGIVSWKPMVEEKIGYLHRMIDVNIKGVVNMTYAAIPVMEKQNEGVIVNIASGAGKIGYPNLAVYSATKFAVIGFTQGIGKELVKKNIRVYAVCPGMTATDMTGFSGIPPEKVAQKILEVATEKLGLKPGEDTEIYT